MAVEADTDQCELDTGVNGDYNGGDSNASVENLKPKLFHKIQNQKSILALAVSNSRIYAGTQDGEILVSKICLRVIALHALTFFCERCGR